MIRGGAIQWLAAAGSLGVLLAAALTPGCQRGAAVTERAAPPPARRPAARPQPPAPTPTPAPPAAEAAPAGESGLTRPANPAALGEGARMLVGRTFEPVYFDEASAELNGAARRRLTEYARWLGENNRVWLTLMGHADTAHGLDFGYNLAMARALAVEDFLVGHGLARRRLYPISFGAAGAGSGELGNRVELMGFMAPAGRDEPAEVSAEPQSPPESEP